MIGDKRKFVSLDENKLGNVTFGNDEAQRIRGKDAISINNGRGKAQDVLFVDGLKRNLLSVSEMCDRGCDVLFRSQDSEFRSQLLGIFWLKEFEQRIMYTF